MSIKTPMGKIDQIMHECWNNTILLQANIIPGSERDRLPDTIIIEQRLLTLVLWHLASVNTHE